MKDVIVGRNWVKGTIFASSCEPIIIPKENFLQKIS
jgi:hypothetical protein